MEKFGFGLAILLADAVKRRTEVDRATCVSLRERLVMVDVLCKVDL